MKMVKEIGRKTPKLRVKPQRLKDGAVYFQKFVK